MVSLADNTMLPTLRKIWKVCFGDSEEYLDLFFNSKYKDTNTLVYSQNDEIVAALYIIPYTITFYQQGLSFAYLMGLSTLPEHRGKGYMKELINKAHLLLEERQIALSILIPADKWLFGYYNQFGYEQVFDKGYEQIKLSEMLGENADIAAAYSVFNKQYRGRDFCVQKSQDDFVTIVEEYKLDQCPPKYNLSGMAKILNVWALLEIFASANSEIKLSIEIEGDTTYLICDGWVEAVDGLIADLTVDNKTLCRLLFGYHIDEMDHKYHKYFSQHEPVINLMLE